MGLTLEAVDRLIDDLPSGLTNKLAVGPWEDRCGVCFLLGKSKAKGAPALLDWHQDPSGIMPEVHELRAWVIYALCGYAAPEQEGK